MEHSRSEAEVADHFTDYINRVADQGEQFVLIRDMEPVAELRPVATTKRLEELPALLESLPRLSEADAASLAEDLAAIRSNLAGPELTDPWQS